ncbi:MAG TPA: PqiC family protein [Crenalkalicoccus sp.]|jgi:uncharacterized lipoprotein YmbA|nr:PqiC family protein [Crenalkalicoccus sp.]
MSPGGRRTLLLALLGTGCARSPSPTYFTLAPVPGTPRPGGPRGVALRRPGLPAYLDRPEIMRATGPYRLDMVPGAVWAAPFADMVARVLAEDLGQRLPGTGVYTEGSGLGDSAPATLVLDLQRFDADAGGRVTLDAQAGLRTGRGRRDRGITVDAMARGPTTDDLVAAMSEALGLLADQLATLLRAS